MNLVHSSSRAQARKASLWLRKTLASNFPLTISIHIPHPSPPALSSIPTTLPAAYVGVCEVLREAAAQGRVRAVELTSASEEDARLVLGAIWPGKDSRGAAAQVDGRTLGGAGEVMESLTIRVESKTPPNLRFVSSNAVFGRLLPGLKTLELENHSTGWISIADTPSPLTPPLLTAENSQTITEPNLSLLPPPKSPFANLHHLKISNAVRFPPLAPSSILNAVLRNTPLLESLIVESRIAEGPRPRIAGGGVSVTESGTVINKAPGAIASCRGATAEGSGSCEDEERKRLASLVHLPHLNTLSIRINAVPSFLSQLLLPNLEVLKVEDLNGKR